MIYAITAAGTSHFVPETLYPKQENTQMTQKIYTDRSNCRRAAKKAGHPDAEIKAVTGGFVWKAKAATAAPAPKTAAKAAPKAAATAKTERKATGKRAAILEAAQNGKLPAAPDFSAKTHERFRAKLASLVALAKAGDVKGLKAFQINPVSSSPKAMAKYRDLCVIALEAKREAKAA